MTSQDLPVGTGELHREDPPRLGRFRLLGRLGGGGMGVVYLGVDHVGRHTAVKVIHPRLAADASSRQGLRREADLMTRIVSPRVPRLLEHSDADTRPYLAMQYLPGVTLTAYFAGRGVLRGFELVAVAAGLAHALAEVHRAGVTHLDVKPSNVLVSSRGVYLLDFGIARPTAAASGPPVVRTAPIVGTPRSMAPEHFTGAPLTTATDVFAWASLVAYAATGRYPFGSSDITAIAARTVHADPEHRRLPAALRHLVRAAFAKTPHNRPTAEQLSSALLDAGTPGAVPRVHRPIWYRHRPASQRRAPA